MLTEDDFREALHRAADPQLSQIHAPTDLVPSVLRRQRRRTAAIGGLGAMALVTAVAAMAIVAPASGTGAGPVLPAAGTAHPSSAAHPVLVSRGACSGLSVGGYVGSPTPVAENLRWVHPGQAANTVTVPGNSVYSMLASGPCTARLGYRTRNPFLQPPNPSLAVNPFVQNLGFVVTYPNAFTGTSTVDLLLTNDSGPSTRLATITVVVTPTGPQPIVTGSPDSGSPDSGLPAGASAAVPSLPDSTGKVPFLHWRPRGTLVSSPFAAAAEVAWDKAKGNHYGTINVVYAGRVGDFTAAVLEDSIQLAIVIQRGNGPITVVDDRPTPQAGGVRELSVLTHVPLDARHPGPLVGFAIVANGESVTITSGIAPPSSSGPRSPVAITDLPASATVANTTLHVRGANGRKVSVPIDHG